MDPARARELLAAERRRIEAALEHLGREETGEPGDDVDPGNLASELYEDEFAEGREDDIRDELAAVERAEARLAAGTYGLSVESGGPRPGRPPRAVTAARPQ